MVSSQYFQKNPLAAYFAIKKNPLDFLSAVQRECGDFARFKILNLDYCLVNDPSLIKEALIEKSDELIIKGGASAGLARLIGRGILTNRGEDWRASRRSLQPLFQATALESYQPIIRARVQESFEHWGKKYGREAFSLNRELLALSFRIKCSTLFQTTPSFEDADAFASAVWIAQLDGMKRYTSGLDFFPYLPLSLNRRVNGAVSTLLRLADSIRKNTEFSVDEIRSLLFAGAESPANTLCWAMELLDRHPDWEEKMLRETVGGNEDADILAQILNEVMRLYPAGWAFERYAPEVCTLGGEQIPKRTRLLFCPFLLHRNSRFFTAAETFDPSRFSKGTGIANFSFLPFATS